MKRMILIVDDEETNLRLLKRVLVDEGYSVVAAASGPEALESSAIVAPDLVLTDIRMPEMDGIELCKRLRNEQRLTMPVIFMTALAQVPTATELADLGALCITKPYEIPPLLEIISRLLTPVPVRPALEPASQPAT